MKKYIFISAIASFSLLNVSCDDFLDTVPHDALSPETTWKTEADAEKFMIGCYSGWMDDGVTLYADCGSDIGFLVTTFTKAGNILETEECLLVSAKYGISITLIQSVIAMIS